MLQMQRGFREENGADESSGVLGPLPALGTSSHHTRMQSSARGWGQGQISLRPLAAWPQNTRNAQPRP